MPFLHIFSLMAALLGIMPVTSAQTTGLVPVASGVTYEFPAHWDSEGL